MSATSAVIKKGIQMMGTRIESRGGRRPTTVNHFHLYNGRSNNPFPKGTGKGLGPRSDHLVGYPLDYEECQAVEELFLENPTVFIGSEWFRSMLFKTPFAAFFGSKERQQFYPLKEEVQDRIIRIYWMPFLNEVYGRLKMHGIVPYYYKKVPLYGGSVKQTQVGDEPLDYHLVPVIPPLGSGEIYTYMNGKEQAFYWRWGTLIMDDDASGQEDGSIYFIIRHMPTIYGRLTSPLKALLKDSIYLELITELTFTLARSMANPIHVIQYNPNLKDATSIAMAQGSRHPGDANPLYGGQSVSFPNFDGPAPQTSLQYVSAFRNRSLAVGAKGRTPLGDLGIPDDVNYRLMGVAHYKEATQQSGLRGQAASAAADSGSGRRYSALNSLRRVRSGSAADGGEEGSTLEDRLALSEMANALLLEPFEQYVAAARPTAYNFDIKTLTQRFDQLTSAAMDFPLTSLIRESISKTTNSSSMTLLESMLKAQNGYFADVIKEVFAIAYLPFIQTIMPDDEGGPITYDEIASTDIATQPERVERLHAQIQVTDIEVVLPRIPLLELNEWLELWKYRVTDIDQTFVGIMESRGTGGVKKAPKEFKKAMERYFPIPPEGSMLPMPPEGGGTAGTTTAKKPASASKPPAKKQKVNMSGGGIKRRRPEFSDEDDEPLVRKKQKVQRTDDEEGGEGDDEMEYRPTFNPLAGLLINGDS